jgi:hypothetical protein
MNMKNTMTNQAAPDTTTNSLLIMLK